MSLLHHVAYDGDFDALEVIEKQSYFKQVIDNNENPVFFFDNFRKNGLHCFGLHQ